MFDFFKKDKKIPVISDGSVPPAYIKKSDAPISNSAVNNTNTDLTSLRTGSTQQDVIKGLIANSPDASFAVYSKNRFAITDSYTVMAYDIT